MNGVHTSNPISGKSRCNLPAGSISPPWRVIVRRIAWHVVWTFFFRPWPRRLGNAWRRSLLICFGARIGSGVFLHPSARIMQPWALKLGDFVAVGEGVHFYNFDQIDVGDMTIISQDCYLCTGTHDYKHPHMPLLISPIIIGSDVWLAAGCFVHPGVTIADGSVVGAKSVVTKSLPPWTVSAGNPCRPIKSRVLKVE